eukprot:CAMPEP_0184333094 /NCGR_PEP_ID=MMETSP1089-20130417/2155_1 /TAXON_ID=38269 ORGANISM="Gloeochaete wittrockiana, Strain SAG46.84" /NCGR_SAMPLE_ID=MMETSP1089 /ASSEMBLY_ACC=CAM_ASM_000445 /LENGTH=392 /DNA_ID=CAMNT_0026656745 /DNA_START=35 /DNA_END=1213 /DNA_ORIENTATION=+
MANLSFSLLAAPTKGSKDDTFRYIKQSIDGFGDAWKFNIPDLRVGTLDNLMALSDELVKIDHFIENVTRKLGTQINRLNEESGPGPVVSLSICGVPINQFLQRFTWDSAKYDKRNSCRELSERLQEQVQNIDEEMRNKVTEYQGLAGAVSQFQRRRTGNLLVRDFSEFVNPDTVYDTTFLKTVFVAVPKQLVPVFLSTYESAVYFSPDADSPAKAVGIVPRSATLLQEDNEYSLYSLVIIKKVEAEFKKAMRENKFTVRETELNFEVNSSQSLQQMIGEKEKFKTKLATWCRVNFDEAFSAWVHLKAIRVHVEALLRYGPEVLYISTLIQPLGKNKDKKIHTGLGTLFSEYANVYQRDSNDEEVVVAGVSNEKFFPYVYLDLNADMTAEIKA